MHLARYWAAAALAWLALPCAHAKEHRFNVRDDIVMTRFSYPDAVPSVPASNIAWPSPDGRWTAIVVSRGILSSDKIESRIVVFNTREAKEALQHPKLPLPQPRVIATVAAYPYGLAIRAHPPVIQDLRWSADNHAVYFKAVDADGNYQLCRARIDGSGLKALTPEDKDVGQFDIAGKTIVFTAADPGTHLIDPGRRINRDAVDITGARIQEVLFPHSVAARVTDRFRLYTLKQDDGLPVIHEVAHYQLLDIPELESIHPFRLSPKGNELIKLEPPESVPRSWTRYSPIAGSEQLRLTYGHDRRMLRADNVLRPLEYTLINLKTGQRTPLLRAPNARSLGYLADANLTVWSRDARHVLVTNTFLPLNSGQAENSASTYPCAIARVDFPSLTSRCLYFEKGNVRSGTFHIQNVAFGRTSDHVEVLLHNHSGKQILRRYTLHSGEWSLTSTQPLEVAVHSLHDLTERRRRHRPRMRIFIRQNLNDPPTLWMSNAAGRQRELWNPNPQFQHIELGQASYFRWKDSTGRAWSAVLLKPTDYVAGERYPLILQMYGYVKGQFMTDGLYPTAFAAREFASAGFVVLQIRKQPDTLSERDPQIALDGYRSAIKRLSALGMINPHKVGVVGFSWTCWYAVYALVHEPKLFAAATIADGLDNSYMQYKLFAVEYYPLRRQMNRIRGGGPWGAHLQHWVDAASEFHLDRVQAPVRIEAINPSSVLQEWGLYASLKLLHKPVDFIYFPNGTHIHQRPLERLESQQGDVDWMRFWLMGKKDSDSLQKAEYPLWEEMQQAQQNRTVNRGALP